MMRVSLKYRPLSDGHVTEPSGSVMKMVKPWWIASCGGPTLISRGMRDQLGWKVSETPFMQ